MLGVKRKFSEDGCKLPEEPVPEHSSEDRSEFPLYLLPELVVGKIARYLSTKDLAACCAVSHGVRQAFDIERVWSPRYDKERAETLLNTPCKVFPFFERPEIPNSGLSPISDYRVAYMAETRLWNNWKQGRYTTDVLKPFSLFVDSYGDDSMFLTNDFVVALYKNVIEIVNVSATPPSLVYRPIYILKGVSSSRLLHDNGSIVLLHYTCVQVFSLNSSDQWMLKHSFNFDKSEIIHDFITVRRETHFFETRLPRDHAALCDTFFVGYRNSRFHIWNYETGIKIKEETCPIKNAAIDKMFISDFKDLILFVKHVPVLVCAYSLVTLKYLPFKVTMEGIYYEKYECKVVGKYILVCNRIKILVYDYLKCKTVIKCCSSNYYLRPVLFGNSIVFYEDNTLMLLNLSNSVMIPIEFDQPSSAIVDCSADWDRFIAVHCLRQIGGNRASLVDIIRHLQESKKAHRHRSMFKNRGECNKLCTRFIKKHVVYHFW